MILPGFPLPVLGGKKVTPVEFVAATGNAAVTTNISCNVPAGTSAGDIIVAVVAVSIANVNVFPHGWSLRFSDTSASPRVFVFTRTATGSEPASYSFPLSGTSQARSQFITFRSASGIVAGTIDRATATSVTAPSISMSAGAYLLGVFGHVSTSPTVSTAPSGMTGLQIPTDTSATRTFIYGQEGVGNPSGTRSITFDISNSVYGLLIEVHP